MTPITPDAEVLRDRVHRASEIREAIGIVWSEYMGQQEQPRRFALVPGGTDKSWTLVVNTLVPMPVRLSTLFGEWLYLLRAALDGLTYYLAVRDSGQNPPPAERNIYFPIKTDASKYDSSGHRSNLQALSNPTFALLRQVQPFNAQPDHKSNALWWIEELARIDRHRRGHALAPHIIASRVRLRQPLRLIKSYLPEPATRAVPINESSPMPILDFEAPNNFGELQVRQHMEIGDALTNILDVTEWVADASEPMASADLNWRMAFCESFVLDGLIEPFMAQPPVT